MKLILAIDVGTSSTRAALVDPSFQVHALSQQAYPLHTPRPGWAEQDLDQVMQALDQAVRACLAQKPAGGKILGISIDTAMHSLVLLDEEDKPLTPLWTWADMRAAPQARDMAADRALAESLYAATGCPVHAVYLPAKIRWLRQERPELLAKTKTLASIKSFLLQRLTGERVEEMAMASTSGLFNVHSLAWHPAALQAAGIDDPILLPRLIAPESIAGHLLDEVARSWNIPAVPVVAGGTDGPFANIGAGAVEAGDMAITVGTSSAVRMIVPAPKLDVLQRTWCYYLGDATWIVGGAINGGGSTLDWLASAFPGLTGGARRHERLDELAESVPPGAEGLIFAPYLAGERNPGWQGAARGYMAGIGLHHRAPHFVRAAMEGIAYQIAWVYQGVAETAGEPRSIRITGGFVNSRVWPQILADVLGRELEVPISNEGSLLGAAAFGFSAVDPSIDWREMARQVPVTARIAPDPSRHQRYQEILRVYQELYEAIRPHFEPVASLGDTGGGELSG